jgi:hypothetical protein
MASEDKTSTSCSACGDLLPEEDDIWGEWERRLESSIDSLRSSSTDGCVTCGLVLKAALSRYEDILERNGGELSIVNAGIHYRVSIELKHSDTAYALEIFTEPRIVHLSHDYDNSLLTT